MRMRHAFLLALLASSHALAAGVCGLLPDVQSKYGATATVSVDLLLISGSWWASSLCARRPLGTGSRVIYLNDPWQANLQVELSPNASRRLTRLIPAVQRADRRGGFLYITADLTGTIETLEPAESRARLAVTGMENLRSVEQPPPSKLPVMSMCDLFADLPSYEGKRVAVRGEVAATGEGAWLVPTEKCSQRFVTQGYPWGFDLWLSGTAGAWLPNRDARARRQTVAGVFVGVVVLLPEYIVQCHFGELKGYGFGHLDGSPAAFWVETVLRPVTGEPIAPNQDVLSHPACTDSSPPPSNR